MIITCCCALCIWILRASITVSSYSITHRQSHQINSTAFTSCCLDYGNSLSVTGRQIQSVQNVTECLITEARVFKESAEQQFPLSVFLAQPLSYFRQPLHSIGSAFSRCCHRCRSREHGRTVVNNVSLYVETM